MNTNPPSQTLLISDSHGNLDDFLAIVTHHEQEVSSLLFMGDGAKEALEVAYLFPDIQFYGVCGNNDFIIQETPTMSFPLERLLHLGQHTIYMTHGHIASYDKVSFEVSKRGETHLATIAIHGHTHYPYAVHKGNLLLLNPGSITYPRNDSHHSYGVIDFNVDTPQPQFRHAKTHDILAI